MTAGAAGSETDGYDLNGNETLVTIYGGTYHDTYDDEDRLTSVALPGGVTDTFTYNGLGLRVGKADSTGTYVYICDGTTPGSPVLSDGHALYTPGLSERRAGVSSFYADDKLGNLWIVNGTGTTQSYYQDTTGFGALTASGGSSATPFKFGGGNGCLTDADTGLVLMGHRYYDSRTGRFLNQDPIGDGDNWYAYCGNSPANGSDPEGLEEIYNPYGPYIPPPPPPPGMPGLGDGGFGAPPEGPPQGWSPSPIGAPPARGDVPGPADANNFGVGGFADTWITFGLVTRAGGAWGAVDSGHGSRAGATLLTAAAVGAVLGAAVTRGGDAAEGDAAKSIGGWISKDVFSTLEQKVGKQSFKKFVAAVQKGVVGPDGQSGIKRLANPIGDYTHELKIGGSGSRILGALGEWNGEAKYIFTLLTGHQ